MAAAKDLARRIAEAAPEAVSATLQMLRLQVRQQSAEAGRELFFSSSTVNI
jgi:enoyl-CoA hydratase/carnithine racemase